MCNFGSGDDISISRGTKHLLPTDNYWIATTIMSAFDSDATSKGISGKTQ